MRKLLFLYLFCASFILTSKAKTDNGPMILKTQEVDFKDKTGDEIKAKMLDLEVIGIQEVYVQDSVLMFVTSDPEAMLKVYDKKTLKPIAGLCQRGRANNEFAGQMVQFYKQQFRRNGDLIMPFTDLSTFIQKEVNISASLRKGHTVIENTCQRSSHNHDFVVLDNGLDKTFTINGLEPDWLRSPDSMPLPVYAVTENNNIVKEIQVFKEHIKHESLLRLGTFYGGQLLKHPDRNLVVMTMRSMDYIMFFDLDNDRNFAIHQKGSPTYADIYIYDDWDKDYHGGTGGPMHIPGTDKFCVVCSSGKYTEQTLAEDGKGVELLVFDYEGNYIGGVKLNRNIQSYSYDPETKTIYAANVVTEEIFTFDLSDFL